MKIESQIIDKIMKSPEAYAGDFLNMEKSVAGSGAIYKGKPVPYLYIPKVYTPEDVSSFEQALDGMMAICDKVIDLYETDPDVRALFGFDSRLEELILKPSGYSRRVPMGRFDIFYYGPDAYMFCELNADGASAMNEETELTSVLMGSKPMLELSETHKIERFELFQSWVNEVGVLYSEFLSNQGTEMSSDSPTVVAIVDFMDKSSPLEFEVFKKAFESKGYRALIVDPRDIGVSGGRMMTNGHEIDVVYRRLVTKDLMDRYDEIPEFIEGLKAGKTCIVGSLKTQIIHTKKFFEALYQNAVRRHLSGEEIAFIEAHVPLTMPLKDFGTEDVLLQNKDQYILKPIDFYASKGVCAGSDYSPEEWKNLLESHFGDTHIIQAYCPVSFTENILYNGKSFEKKDFRTITGLFVYNGKLAGVYTRAGLNAIISGLHDGYTLSSVVVKSKK